MKHSFKTLLTLALALVVGNVWGETVTSIFRDKNWKVGQTEEAWTATGATATAIETSGSARGVQVTLANIKSSGLTLTNTSIKELGAISKVEIIYSSNCSGSSDGTIAVAVGSTEFGSAFTIKKENNATISFENATAVEGDIVITFTSTATSKSVYVKSITVTYSETTPTDDVLESLVVSGTPTKTEYKVGDAFDPAGLKVTGTYSESGEKDVTSGITWTADPETFTGASTNATVSVTAKVGTITSAAFNVTGLTVTEPAPSVAWDAREQDYVASTTAVADITFGDGTIVTGAFDKGTNGNAPKYYLNTEGNNSTGAVRVYAGSTLTLQAQAGYKICGVKFGFGQGDKTNAITANTGTFSTDTWSGSTTQVVFTVDGASGHRRFQTITVSYEASSAVATPAFSVKEGVFFDAFDLTLTCATDGAAIHYTTDGTTPTSASAVYSSAISISATTTVKAIATKSGMDDSEVASATYTLGKSYASLAALVADGEPTGATVRVTLTDEPIVSLVSTNGIMLQATEEKQIEVFCYDRPTDWEVGGKVSATLICPWKKYNDTWELCPDSWNDITYTAPVVAKYQVEIDDMIENGSVIANVTEAAAGATVTLTAAPADGYEFESWYVLDANTDEVPVTGNSFTMPACDVLVSATFVKSDKVTATYDFTTAEGLAAAGIEAPSTGAGTMLDAAYRSGAITLTATNGSTATRIYNSKGNTDLRVYKSGGSITLASPTAISKIVMTGSSLGSFAANTGTYASGTWTGDATSVTFTASATVNVYTITIYYAAPKTQDITITSAGWATVCVDFDATVSGATAYYVTVEGGVAKLTEIKDVIPAETGVLLEGEGTATFTEAVLDEDNIEESWADNQLTGTLTATTYTAVKGSHNYVYVLGQKDGVVGFYKLSGTGTIKANSAYLALDEDPASGSIIIRKGDATAISLVQENGGEAVIYDLLGRRVSEPMRGIYIVNGKKMFIK